MLLPLAAAHYGEAAAPESGSLLLALTGAVYAGQDTTPASGSLLLALAPALYVVDDTPPPEEPGRGGGPGTGGRGPSGYSTTRRERRRFPWLAPELLAPLEPEEFDELAEALEGAGGEDLAIAFAALGIAL